MGRKNMLMFTFIQPGITCSCKAAIAIPRLYFCGFCRFHQHILSRLVESLSTDVSYSASTSAIPEGLATFEVVTKITMENADKI